MKMENNRRNSHRSSVRFPAEICREIIMELREMVQWLEIGVLTLSEEEVYELGMFHNMITLINEMNENNYNQINHPPSPRGN